VRPVKRCGGRDSSTSGTSFVDEKEHDHVADTYTGRRKEADTNACRRDGKRTGALVYRATRCGADTILSQIVRMVPKMPRREAARVRIWSTEFTKCGVVPAVHGDLRTDFSLIWLTVGPQPMRWGSRWWPVLAVLDYVPALVAMGLANADPSIWSHGNEVAELGVLVSQGECRLRPWQGWMPRLDKTRDADPPGRPEGDRSGRLQRLEPGPMLASWSPLSSPSQSTRSPQRSSAMPMAEGCPPGARSHLYVPDGPTAFRAEVEAIAAGRGRTRFRTLEGVSLAHKRGGRPQWGADGKTPLFARC